jgi:hypothetical protein
MLDVRVKDSRPRGFKRTTVNEIIASRNLGLKNLCFNYIMHMILNFENYFNWDLIILPAKYLRILE